MHIETVKEMDNESLNIAIAEKCGWRLITDDPNRHPYWTNPDYMDGRMIAEEYAKHHLPSYTTDLNIIYELEKKMSDLVFAKYIMVLINEYSRHEDIIYDDDRLSFESIRRICNASCRERAEAVLFVMDSLCM